MSFLFTILVVFVAWSFYIVIGMIVRDSVDEFHYRHDAPVILILVWPLAVAMLVVMFWIAGARRIWAKITQ